MLFNIAFQSTDFSLTKAVARLLRCACRMAACAVLCVLAQAPALAAPAGTQVVTIGLFSYADDARYDARRLERRYPGQAQGRIAQAAQLSLADAQIELDVVGARISLVDLQAKDSADTGRVLQLAKKQKVQHLLLDIPESAWPTLLAQSEAILGAETVLWNVGSPSDMLRGKGCARQLLHTYPSAQMELDALAQYLVSRSWRRVLLLHKSGATGSEQERVVAWRKTAQRFGLELVDERQFVNSGDPRERDFANTRLLTKDIGGWRRYLPGYQGYDVVGVVDGDGEFARNLPYNTALARPVVGDNGLSALAWHPQWERYGAPQLNRRFMRAAGRPMASQDWATWVAIKAVVTALVDLPGAALPAQLTALRSGKVFVDGFKGSRLSFRSWDGQLRQPLLLAHPDGVVGLAPLDGVLHPKEILDTLGADEKESLCTKR